MKSFSKIFSLGDRHITDILQTEVEITEKIDGSQFGFGINDKGELECSSKGVEINKDCPDSLFKEAVDYVLSQEHQIRCLFPKSFSPSGAYFWTEYVKKPKHNLLHYTRIPKNHLMLFGCEINGGLVNDYYYLRDIAGALNIEIVPLLYRGIIDVDGIKELLNKDSVLGGTEIEGVVVKNYQLEIQVCGSIFLPAFGKYVSEKFKEKGDKEWKTEHTTKGKVDTFIDNLRTEARWNKAIQHLKEKGLLENAPKDIGILIPEIIRDVVEEEEDFIKNGLYSLHLDQIKRVVIKGFPDFYKNLLLSKMETLYK